MSGPYPDPSDPHGSGPPPPALALDGDTRGWAVAAHLSAFVGAWVFLAFIGPLVVWIVGRERHPFVDHHAKEALNFNLTLLLIGAVAAVVGIVGGVLTLGLALIVIIPIGIILAIVLGLLWIILPIVAAVKAWDGEGYRYPICIRFVS